MFSSTAFSTAAAEAVPFYVDPNITTTAVLSTLDGSKKLQTINTAAAESGSRHGIWINHHNATVRSHYAQVMVRAVDAGVEGFEYKLLPHLIRHSADALCALGVLAIEWHAFQMPNTRQAASETGMLSGFMRHAVCNVTVLPALDLRYLPPWIPLSVVNDQ